LPCDEIIAGVARDQRLCAIDRAALLAGRLFVPATIDDDATIAQRDPPMQIRRTLVLHFVCTR